MRDVNIVRRMCAVVAVGCALSSAGTEIRPFRPKVPDVFTAPPAGAVKPHGWMLDRARAAAKGLTGHLDEVDEEFRRAWRSDLRPTADHLTWQTGAWSFEGGGYWFDGLVRLAAQLDDAGLAEKARRRFEPVLADANPRGIGLLTWLDRDDPAQFAAVCRADNGFSLAKCGLMARALGAYWEVSRDERVPEVLARAFDDERILRVGNALHLPVAAFDAWRMTGDATTAKALDGYYRRCETIASPGVRFSRLPDPGTFNMSDVRRPGEDWRPQHGVMFNESLLAWVRGWQWTGREDFRKAVFAWMDWLDANAMQPHGVIVADEAFGHPGANRGTETCTVAASVWLRLQLLAATGDARWADGAERAILNAMPACVNRAYTKHVYFQTPNRTTPLKPVYRGETPLTPFRYETKHYPMCCTADLTRMIPMAIQYKWLTDDEGVVAALYGPDEAVLPAGGTRVRLRTETDYPFDERIVIRVSPETAAEWVLKLRIPAWCDSPAIGVNGETVPPEIRNGFAVLRRKWREGDSVALTLPMRARLETGTDRNTGEAYATVGYGPLLMAAPLWEFDDNTPVWRQDSGWKVNPATALSRAKVVRRPMPAHFDWPLDSPLKLEIDTSLGRVALVPYGSTRFRVSMFPVADGSFVNTDN